MGFASTFLRVAAPDPYGARPVRVPYGDLEQAMKKTAGEAAADPLERGRNKKGLLYLQLAAILRREIEGGAYRADDRFPSLDDLAAKFCLNKVTVHRALKELQAAGLLYSIPAKGTFVSGRAPQGGAAVAAPDSYFTVGLASCVMISGAIEFYHLQMLEAFRKALGEIHANLVLLPAQQPEASSRLVDRVMRSRLDAVVFVGPVEASMLRQLVGRGPKVVLVDHSAPGIEVDAIHIDNRGGAFQAIRHLLENGHRDLAVVTGDAQPVTAERMEGVWDALDQFGVPRPSLIVARGDFTEASGARAMRELLAGPRRPTAVFFMNDEMALGGIPVIREAGLEIPDDISVIGFDNIRLPGNRHLNLTTIDAPVGQMVRLAVRWLHEFRTAPYAGVRNTRLVTTLVSRGTVAPPRGAGAAGQAPSP